MDWQPIATFPEDGEYLCYDPVARKFDVCHRIDMGRHSYISAVQVDGLYGPMDDEFQGERATVWARLEHPVTVAEGKK